MMQRNPTRRRCRRTPNFVRQRLGRFPRDKPRRTESAVSPAQERVPRSRGWPAGRLGQPFYGWFAFAFKLHSGRF